MPRITPNADQFRELATSSETGPVVMLNLLKFKERADGGRASGGKEYQRYGDAAVEMIEARGGNVLWSGRADQILIGDPEQDWDAVVLVQYPSRQAFVDMVTTDEYNEAHTHREGGLERTIVVACTPRTGAVS
jgi:uncharacterized protein (DUF1330 family)